MGYKRGSYRTLVGRHDRNRPLGICKRGWEAILKCIFKKLDEGEGEGSWTRLIWLMKGTGGGLL
jgi:hypothetical protein